MAINRELAGRVADAIEGRTIAGLGFDMAVWLESDDDDFEVEDHHRPDHECNTVGCMAGWTVALADGLEKAGKYLSIMSRAQTLLGLTHSEAVVLFGETAATDEEAVQHLRLIAAGGDVDWSRVSPRFRPPSL